MTRVDPSAFLDVVQKGIANYRGNAPAVLMEVERNGLSVGAADGVVAIGQDVPVTIDAIFQIGSQTKMMTATVLLQLASEEQLSLDDKLSEVMDVSSLSGIPNINDVTLRQLMTHQSGIPDYATDFLNEANIPIVYEPVLGDPPQPIGVREALQFLNDQKAPAEFSPGGGFEYSNTGFLLLQLAIENVTGSPLAEVFQTRIFDPVGMTSTSLPGFERPDGVLNSYRELGGELLDVTLLPIDAGGDGGAFSTTGDMIKFMKALVIEGNLISSDQLEGLEQFFAAADIGDDNFIGHNGGTEGTNSITLLHLPTGTIFSAAESIVQEGELFDEMFVSTILDVLTNETWQSFQSGDGDLDFAITAAEINVNEALGVDGSAQTFFEMQGVTLALDGLLGDLDTDRFSFEDGSLLFVADEKGSRFSIQNQAKEASHADNQLIGQSGDDRLIGGSGDDKLVGGAGEDKLVGRDGHDQIDGGTGDDRLLGGKGTDELDGGAGDDILKGGRGDDRLVGGSGDDQLIGGRGSDEINGGVGHDLLKGGRGDDRLNGNAGNDIFIGGAGADTFVFTADGGSDLILDFRTGVDQIDLSGMDVGFEDLKISNSFFGYVKEIALDNQTITLIGVEADLSMDDFLF